MYAIIYLAIQFTSQIRWDTTCPILFIFNSTWYLCMGIRGLFWSSQRCEKLILLTVEAKYNQGLRQGTLLYMGIPLLHGCMLILASHDSSVKEWMYLTVCPALSTAVGEPKAIGPQLKTVFKCGVTPLRKMPSVSWWTWDAYGQTCSTENFLILRQSS